MTEETTQTRVRVNRGVAWIGLASSAVGVLDFAAILILLRHWISVDQYGIATAAIWTFPILDLATDMGLSSAVIQKEDHTPERISTIFWLNLFMSLILWGLLVIAAPHLGHLRGVYYPVVGHMVITYGGKLIFQNIYSIPFAMLKRELRFRELSILRIVSNVGEFAGKLGFAAAGFGVWAFVLGSLCRVFLFGVGVQILHPWRPQFVLKVRDAASYASFGFKTSASQILFQVYTNVDYLVVGHYFGAAALGLYRFAYELVLEPVRIISFVAVDIAFPAFVRLRNRRGQLIEQFIAFPRQNLVVVTPFLAFIYLAAEPFILVAWGRPELTAAAAAARLMCLVGVLRALSFVVPPLLDATGYPEITLLYTGVATFVLVTLYIVCAKLLGPSYGYLSVAIAWAIGYPVAFAALSALALRRIGLSAVAYLRRI